MSQFEPLRIYAGLRVFHQPMINQLYLPDLQIINFRIWGFHRTDQRTTMFVFFCEIAGFQWDRLLLTF
jgi:hypothetical protein